MATRSKTSVTPKTKSTKTRAGKKANRAADDAAKRAGKTEQNYDEKQGMFTK